jgi:hypothetical protein
MLKNNETLVPAPVFSVHSGNSAEAGAVFTEGKNSPYKTIKGIHNVD